MKQIFKKSWFYLLIVFIWFFQFFYTLQSNNKIRLEELAESIRNVFWLQHRLIYDGISSNVGWYGTLLVVYNLFGFSLFTAKYFRLFLHLLFLLSLGAIFNKYLGRKKNWLLLLAIGLSPTLLYFNALQTSFGLDLQYSAICLYLLLSLDFSRPLQATFKQFCFGFLAMAASMSYPSFLAYLPVFFIIYVFLLLKNKKKLKFKFIFKNVFLLLLSFCLPLLIVFSYLKNPELLIYDSKVQSGLFRGGGQMPQSWKEVITNVISGAKQVQKDLFLYPNSFYFETDIVRSEFSHKILLISGVSILVLSIWLFIKVEKTRLAIFLSWFLILTSLIVGNFSGMTPGIRRSSGVLASFYGFYVLVWGFHQRFNSRLLRLMIFVFLLLIVFHHFKVYRDNYYALRLPNPHAADACFNKIPNNPAKSLEKYVTWAKEGKKLDNHSEDEGGLVCRLWAIYSAAAGSCLWNRFNCPAIYGYDENTGDFILLSTQLWENYYFGH